MKNYLKKLKQIRRGEIDTSELASKFESKERIPEASKTVSINKFNNVLFSSESLE
jgi:hypothetical protein